MSPIKHCRFTSSKQVCLPHRPCQWSTEPVDICRLQGSNWDQPQASNKHDHQNSISKLSKLSKHIEATALWFSQFSPFKHLFKTYLVQVSPTLVPVLTLLRRERSVVWRSAARVRVTCAAGYGVTDLGNSLTSQRPTLNPPKSTDINWTLVKSCKVL